MLLLSNSGITVGEGVWGECPLRFFTGKFLLTYWEKRGEEKKWKWRTKGGKLYKWRWKIENGRGKKYANEQRTFSAFHFLKQLKFVLGLPKWKFSTGKKCFTPAGKNQEKWLCPLWKKYSCYATAFVATVVGNTGKGGVNEAIGAVSLFPVVSTLWVLLICVCSVRYYALNYAWVAAHCGIIYLSFNVVILATIACILKRGVNNYSPGISPDYKDLIYFSSVL